MYCCDTVALNVSGLMTVLSLECGINRIVCRSCSRTIGTLERGGICISHGGLMAWSVKMPVGLCVVLRLAVCCWECR